MTSPNRPANCTDQRPTRRIAIYCHISKRHVPVMATDKEPQMHLIAEFIKGNRQSEEWLVESVDTYVDVRRTAEETQDGLWRLLCDARQGNIDTVIGASAKHILHDPLGFVLVASFLDAHGVRLITVVDGHDTASVEGRKRFAALLCKVIKRFKNEGKKRSDENN